MEDAQRWLGDQKVWLNRGDLGFGQDAVMSWHEEKPDRPHYLFKLKLSSRVRAALHAVKEEAWQGPATQGAWQLAEGEVQLTGWKRSRRVVFARQFQGVVASEKNGEFWDLTKHEFAVYVTNLPETYTCWQIQIMYRERADVENVFDELKNQWGFSGFSAKSRATSELAARLLLVVYNLWVLFVRFILNSAVEKAGGSGSSWSVCRSYLLEARKEFTRWVKVIFAFPRRVGKCVCR
jgi:hypothetical protein